MDNTLIVVGSGSIKLSGCDIQPKDIDIVVNDTTDLERFLDIKKFNTKGIYTSTGKRAYASYKGYIIDIFIGEVVSDIDEIDIDGTKVKYQTLKGYEEYCWRMVKHHKKRVNKNYIRDKLNVVKKYI